MHLQYLLCIYLCVSAYRAIAIVEVVRVAMYLLYG